MLRVGSVKGSQMRVESVSVDVNFSGDELMDLQINLRGQGPEDMEALKKAILILAGQPLEDIVQQQPALTMNRELTEKERNQ